MTPDGIGVVRESPKGDAGSQADLPSGRKETKEVQSKRKYITCPCILYLLYLLKPMEIHNLSLYLLYLLYLTVFMYLSTF